MNNVKSSIAFSAKYILTDLGFWEIACSKSGKSPVDMNRQMLN